MHKYNLGQIDKMDVKLSEHQKKLLGFDDFKDKKVSRPASRASVLTKNMAHQTLLNKEEKMSKSPLKTARTRPMNNSGVRVKESSDSINKMTGKSKLQSMGKVGSVR